MSGVLIIEDSQPLITLFIKKFTLKGIDCDFILQTGELTREDIVDKIYESDPELIILDLKMPGSGGIAVLEELRHRERESGGPAYPLVILTALKADRNDIEFLKKEAKVVDFITKPITNIDGFIDRINDILNEA